MAETGCGSCKFRAKYDANRKSILGRLWRWHIGWCPGWKKHMNTVSEEERQALIEKYNIKVKKA